MLTLKADIRDKSAKTAQIHEAGNMPAVFYGKKEASTPISISKKDFMKVWEEAGESSVITLETPDGSKESLIHDVDIDPISGMPRHADFYVFEKGHKVTVELPIEFEGVSPAVKELGGVLVKVLHTLEVEAVPKDLPHNIIIDLATLTQIGDQVIAQNISLPSGVELVSGPEEVIALIAAARDEVEEESAPVDLSEIEVVKKGKEETEESTEEAA
jgi:large subunit ribosomal protein L25